MSYLMQAGRFSQSSAYIYMNVQRTQISGRHYSNGTKHGIWPPWGWSNIKDRNMQRF